jgi:2,4-dienoyl-CoA reductase-like NADH-dependent reductase (Old Yellow Enzyme family)
MEYPVKSTTSRDHTAAAAAATILNVPLTLPCGVTLPNRLAKGAMSELLADSRNRATVATDRQRPNRSPTP